MTIKPGDKIPAATLMEMQDGKPAPVSTDSFFAGKKVALFALPGAFTPTCSAKHVPGYVDNYDTLKSKGIDAIACVSVNDAFVMGAWGKDQKADGKVHMLADGNGDFTRAIGLEFDASKFHDRRQWRGQDRECGRAGRFRSVQRRTHHHAASVVSRISAGSHPALIDLRAHFPGDRNDRQPRSSAHHAWRARRPGCATGLHS